jgi:hypothetical protein
MIMHVSKAALACAMSVVLSHPLLAADAPRRVKVLRDDQQCYSPAITIPVKYCTVCGPGMDIAPPQGICSNEAYACTDASFKYQQGSPEYQQANRLVFLAPYQLSTTVIVIGSSKRATAGSVLAPNTANLSVQPTTSIPGSIYVSGVGGRDVFGGAVLCAYTN